MLWGLVIVGIGIAFYLRYSSYAYIVLVELVNHCKAVLLSQTYNDDQACDFLSTLNRK